MKELREIIRAYDEAVGKGKKTALATVVRVEGSAYRREGGRMLITEEGQLTGAISGGCLEGDALRKALYVMQRQKPMLVRYDTTGDDHGIGLQLGCEGLVHLLIEPLHENPPEGALSSNHPITFFKAIFEKRQATAIATVYNLEDRKAKQLGTLCIFDKTGKAIATSTSFSPQIEQQITEKAQEVLRRGRSAFFDIAIAGHTNCIFLEYIPTQPNIVVFGAGNDIRPLVGFAGILGWEITVVDGRPKLATKERFHQATCVMTAKPDVALAQIEADKNTFFLLMTHNYNYDLAVLDILLQKKVRYIGILGPKKKYQRMLDDLKEKRSEKELSHIFAPIGLDIGGGTPESVALSIVAEIQAVLSGRVGGFLRDRDAPIHG